MPPNVAVRITVYVPAGVPCVVVVIGNELPPLLPPPPQPESPTAISRTIAMESRRRLGIHIIGIRQLKPKMTAGAERLQGKRSGFVIMLAAMVWAVVAIVTVNGTAR